MGELVMLRRAEARNVERERPDQPLQAFLANYKCSPPRRVSDAELPKSGPQDRQENLRERFWAHEERAVVSRPTDT